ncbi:leucine-rich repeat and guanylate kinase domain-containing protein isoform X4 [Pezoporus flaviventris]|uniref:leucine-rich repeat and guanylate kinase domain-containing protein isoform X4 n=1 Tax=Pezoporus flaviventris TaxID=889875 RepID=UPI002AB0AC31|nr:leucine-rich repeat and guanylate kinase domain-containing protein isoform X4 [Pezoporus flaviventris]
MAGGKEKRGGGSLHERLPPPPPQPPQPQQPQDRPSLQQPRPSLPHPEDKQEEDGKEEESQHTEGQLEGVLDEDIVAEGLHELGRSATGIEYVYLNLSLSGRELSDISILSRYIHLQKLELSSNKINDLSCVSYMPYLLELNASNNELTTYFGFKPPKNLKVVDFSYNQIPKMENLSAYESLTKLFLDFNNIEELQGLGKCHSLTHLSLSHNRLVAISGLENLPIKILNLSFNQIEKITGLGSLKALQTLDLSSNKITSLEGLKKHDLLQVINLEDNQIAELSELKHLEDLPLLRVLNLLKNPVQEQADYWLSVIFMLLKLTELDLKKISVKEKVAAVNKYDPPPEVVAAKDHMTHVMRGMMQPQKIFDSTLPSLDTPYPMLVFAGPVACGKRELTHKICRQFNNFFRFGPCHTTREAYFGEENRLDYYFVTQEEFDKMVNMGQFIATYKYNGYSYGLARDTIESIAREGLATCVELELEGLRSLKNTYFQPRCILLVPLSKGKYEEHLRRKGLFSRSEIEEAVSRVDMYINMTEDFPGYFDATVYIDELDEAFRELSFIVREYLDLKPPAAADSIQDSNSRVGAASRIQLLRQQRFSPGGVTTGTIQSSFVSEFLDSSAKSYRGGISEKHAAQLRSMEEASFQRRFCALRQALSGKAPNASGQPFQRDLAATPAPGSSHQQFLEPIMYASVLSDGRNMTQDQSFPLSNPVGRKSKVKKAIKGKDCKESGPARGRFLISAGSSAAGGLPVRSPVPHAHLPEEAKAKHQNPRRAEDGVRRLKDTEFSAENPQRKHSKSKAGSSQVPQLSNWAGSKPVLPPIPSGRKKTTH